MNAIDLMSKNFRHTFLPFLEWIGELRKRDVLRADIVAGITVALVLVPQSMAYAQLAGLPVYYGLYASFLPPIVAALFGSSRQLATGPVAVVSLMTAAALEPLAATGSEGYIAYAVLLAILVGLFQISLGLLRLGMLVDFLSHPVVIGFTNAGAIIIATSQLGKLFGVATVKAEHHYETVWNTLVTASQSTHWLTLGYAVLAFVILILLKWYSPRVPRVLVAVMVTTMLSWLLQFQEMGGQVVGAIPKGLPAISLPQFDVTVVLELIPIAVTISLIGFMEAISIAKAMAATTRQRLDANQELVGQGLSNIVAGVFQAYPVSGSFSRSAVNINAGAITGFSSIVTGLVVAITLLWLTPLLYHLPQATLAAVIIMAVVDLVKIEPIRHAWKVQKHDGAIAIVTFCLTLLWAPHLDRGIIMGVVLSLILFLYRTMRPGVAVLSRHPDGTLRDANIHGLELCPNISILRFDGSLYFANAGYFENKILELVASKPDLKYVIIDAEGINEIDASGEEMLQHLYNSLQAAEIDLLIARAKKPVMDIFRRTGFIERLGADHYFRLRTNAMEYAWRHIGPEHAATCPLNIIRPQQQAVAPSAQAEQGNPTA